MKYKYERSFSKALKNQVLRQLKKTTITIPYGGDNI